MSVCVFCAFTNTIRNNNFNIHKFERELRLAQWGFLENLLYYWTCNTENLFSSYEHDSRHLCVLLFVIKNCTSFLVRTLTPLLSRSLSLSLPLFFTSSLWKYIRKKTSHMCWRYKTFDIESYFYPPHIPRNRLIANYFYRNQKLLGLNSNPFPLIWSNWNVRI